MKGGLGGALLLAVAGIVAVLFALSRTPAPDRTARAREPAPEAPMPEAPPPDPPHVPAPEPVPESPEPGARLVGHVTDEDGAPIPDAGIWLSKGEGPGEGEVITRTGTDGRYVYDGVDGAQRFVGAIAAKHAPSELRKVAPRTGTVFEIDFTLRRGGGALAIAVANTESADVFIEPVFRGTAESGGRRRVSVSGGAVLDGLVPDWSLVRVRAPGRAPQTLLTRLPPEGVVDADVRLMDGAVVFGTVHAADGAPAPGARVELVGWEWAKVAVVADDLGEYRLTHAPVAVAELRATGADGAEARTLLKLEEGKEHRWDPVLQLPAEITGRVVDEDGAPVAHASLSCLAVPFFRDYTEWLEADAEGGFRFARLPNRAHRVAAWWPGWFAKVPPAAEVTVMPGAPPLTIVLPRAEGALVGIILTREGLPANGARARVWPSGNPNREVRGLAAADGSFRLGPLPTGSYTLELHLDGEPTLFRDGIGVTAGETTNLDVLRFAAGGRIRARIIIPAGTPFFDDDDPMIRSLDGSVTYVVTQDGDAVISEDLVPGRYLVSGGMAGIIEEAEVKEGETTNVDLKLRGGGILEAATLLEDGSRTMATYRITDDRGHPVPGIERPAGPLRMRLASGYYKIEAEGAAGGRASGEVEMPSDGSEVRIALALR